MTDRWFEDFEVGLRLVSSGKTLSEAEMLDWAFHYDPQPFHMDTVAAGEHMYGGLIASGWQVCAVAFRLFTMTNPFGRSSLGSPGVDELRWQRPVRPGDTIHTEVTVTACRPSASKPDRGIVTMAWSVLNQHGEQVMSMTSVQFVLRRPA
jgi:acyl dehydratase